MDWLKTVLQNILKSPRMTPSELLYNMALSYIGTDASPKDLAPDDNGCMETVDTIYKKTFGRYINGSTPMLSTRDGYAYLASSSRFKRIYAPQTGCIVISPTGSPGTTGSGHTGIVGKYQIMSNDSRSGTWEANYSREGWPRIFARQGFPTNYFIPL